MKARLAWLIAGLMVVHGVSLALAANLAEKVKVELESTEPLPFGIYGEVLEGGSVAIGDPVALLE